MLSYAALDAHANRLAHHLQSLGVGPETMVGLLVERSLEMVVGLLASSRPAAPICRSTRTIRASGWPFMLADAGAARAADAGGAARRGCRCRRRPAASALDGAARRRLAPAIARQPADRAAAGRLDPRHPAYVIYTSGSTGTPKGVVVEATARLSNFCGSMAEQVPLEAGRPAARRHHHRLRHRGAGALSAAARRRRGRAARRASTVQDAHGSGEDDRREPRHRDAGDADAVAERCMAEGGADAAGSRAALPC